MLATAVSFQVMKDDYRSPLLSEDRRRPAKIKAILPHSRAKLSSFARRSMLGCPQDRIARPGQSERMEWRPGW
jgi:hypothetical protein